MKIVLLFLLSTSVLTAQKSLTLQEAMQRAVSNSPGMAAQVQELGVKEGELIQASLIPNPAFDFTMAPILGTGPCKEFGGGVFSYEIQQLVETCGKRDMRTKFARADKLVTEWEIEEAMRDLRATVQKSFIQTALAQEKVAIFRNNVEISHKALESVEQRVAEGKETQTQLHKAMIQESQNRLLLGNREREFDLAKKILASYWNAEELDFECVEYDLLTTPEIPDFEWVKDQLQHYPGYVKAYMEYSRAHHQISLERSNGCPDVLVTVGVDQFLSDNSYGFKLEFNVPIPLFNHNQGKVTAAEHALDQTAFKREQVYLDYLNEVRSLYKSLLDSYYQATEYEKNILSTAVMSFEHAREGFHQGKYHYIDMLDAQRTLFEVRDQFVSSIAALHIVMAELDKYTGTFSGYCLSADTLPVKIGDEILARKKNNRSILPWKRKARKRPDKEVTNNAKEQVDDPAYFNHFDSSCLAHTVLVD